MWIATSVSNPISGYLLLFCHCLIGILCHRANKRAIDMLLLHVLSFSLDKSTCFSVLGIFTPPDAVTLYCCFFYAHSLAMNLKFAIFRLSQLKPGLCTQRDVPAKTSTVTPCHSKPYLTEVPAMDGLSWFGHTRCIAALVCRGGRKKDKLVQ